MRWLYFCLLLLFPQPALAGWFKATSGHFVVYGEGSADSVRAYAEKLEKFDGVLAKMTGLETEGDANRLIVFLVDGTSAVQRQMGTKDSGVAGFYEPQLWGTIAVVPRQAGNSEYELNAQTVLFHEYAHHFMLQNAPVAYPAWYVEGFAEFWSTIEFARDGAISVGKPAKHRFYGLAMLPAFPVERLLVPDDRELKDDQREAFYGWSWLLTHYLRFAPGRKGQLTSYLHAFADGAAPRDAAIKAFGPVKDLQKELTAYLDATHWSYSQLTGVVLPGARIDVVQLSPSQSAAMPLFMRTYRASRTKAEVDAVVADARKLAARFPGEPMALDILAEFELDAGNYDVSQKANDAVTAANPADSHALMRAARIAETRLSGKGSTQQWKAVRSLIVKANRAAPNDPFPLWAYYRWYGQSGTPMDKVAIDGLRRALELAPQVAMLRFNLAQQDFRDGNETGARAVLAPLLNDPHSASIRNAARAMLDSKGKTSDPEPPL